MSLSFCFSAGKRDAACGTVFRESSFTCSDRYAGGILFQERQCPDVSVRCAPAALSACGSSPACVEAEQSAEHRSRHSVIYDIDIS